MDREMGERVRGIFRAVSKDRKYADLSKKYERLYKEFDCLVNCYPEEEQDIIWAFVCHSEEMNWRLLEWLCERYDIKP